MANRSFYYFFFFLVAILPLVAAQFGPPDLIEWRHHGGPSSSPSSSAPDGGHYNYKQSASFKKSSRILITHAVLGTLAWAFFAPLGAILIRLDIPGVNLLRLHIICQVSVYAMTIATAGLGIWTAIGASKYGSIWTNCHVVIGLVVFAVASIQPWLGWIHHIIFKRRMINLRKGADTKTPGRTSITVSHIWIGRTLILLGVINGGLGLRLAATTPFQTQSTTRKAEIAYGVLAGLMFLLFAAVSIVFEHRRAARLTTAMITKQIFIPHNGQGSPANQRFMQFSPMSSQNSLESEEKGCFFYSGRVDPVTDVFRDVQNHFQQMKKEKLGLILGEAALTLSQSTLGVKHYFIQEKVESKEIDTQRVNTGDNMANIFTRPLPPPAMKI